MIKRLSNIDSVKEIKVIEVISIRGEGTKENPIEQITEYFLPNGTILARIDMNSNLNNILETKK